MSAVRYAPVAGLLVVLPACTLVYTPALRGGPGFLPDSLAGIEQNEAVQIRELDPDSLLQVFSSGFAGPLGRPISMLSFALHYYFDATELRHFRLVNLLLHLVNGCLRKTVRQRPWRWCGGSSPAIRTAAP